MFGKLLFVMIAASVFSKNRLVWTVGFVSTFGAVAIANIGPRLWLSPFQLSSALLIAQVAIARPFVPPAHHLRLLCIATVILGPISFIAAHDVLGDSIFLLYGIVFVVACAKLMADDESTRQTMIEGFRSGVALSCIVAIYQQVLGQLDLEHLSRFFNNVTSPLASSHVFVRYTIGDHPIYRTSGLCNEPSYLAFSCTAAICFAWLLPVSSPRSRVLTLLHVVGLVCSGSRTALVGAFCIMVFRALWRDRIGSGGHLRRVILAAAVLSPAIVLALAVGSTHHRVDRLGEGGKAIVQRPIVGSGYGAVVEVHDFFLYFLAGGGIFALPLLYATYRTLRSPGGGRREKFVLSDPSLAFHRTAMFATMLLVFESSGFQPLYGVSWMWLAVWQASSADAFSLLRSPSLVAGRK